MSVKPKAAMREPVRHSGMARRARPGIHSPSWISSIPGSPLARRPGMTMLKLHLRRLIENLALLDTDVEEFLLREAERAGEQYRRELLDPGIVFLHRVVEEAAGGGELVLDVAELSLELLEVRAGLEVGIGLAQCKQLPQCAAQHVLGRGLGGNASRLSSDSCVARLHHGFERAALVTGIAFHRFDEVRNEIVPLL